MKKKNLSPCLVGKKILSPQGKTIAPHRYQLVRPLACPDIFIDGSPLTMVENAKYLGVTLNDRCRDDNDIRRHLRSFYMRANTVIRKFNNCTLDIKLMLFRSYCLPSYCSHLWHRYNKCLYTKVRVAFNNGYRRILGFSKRDSASFMFATCRVDNFDCLCERIFTTLYSD